MLEYFALAILCLSVTAIFYLFIFIHDLPYNIAKKRNHPQKEAIHYACWLSLFTLHAIWPIIFMWSVMNRSALRVRLDQDSSDLQNELLSLQERISMLEKKLDKQKGEVGNA